MFLSSLISFPCWLSGNSKKRSLIFLLESVFFFFVVKFYVYIWSCSYHCYVMFRKELIFRRKSLITIRKMPYQHIFYFPILFHFCPYCSYILPILIYYYREVFFLNL